MVGSLVGVSLIARELGADVRGQVFAVVVAATIPLGILQASSTQTDYAGSYWVVCLVYFLLALMKRPEHERIGIGPSLLAGGSLGLALLTKATAYVHGFPFLVWYGLSGGWSRARRVLPSLVIVLLVAGGLNVGYYGRNLQLFGSLFGPGGTEECDQCKLTNEAVTLPLFLSNVMRHMGSHLRTPSQELNNAVIYLIGEGHRLIGADIADPRSTWRQMLFFLPPPEFEENTDGNPVHLVLIFWTVGLVLMKRERFSVLARRYAQVLIATFLLYCLVIKWAPPNIRYQLGLFILWAPVTGIALARCRRPVTPLLVVLALVLLSVPWLVLNRYRPLIGEENILNTPRESQLFIHRDGQRFRESFEGSARFLSQHQCWQVGIIRGQDDMAYPLWVLLRGASPGTVQIEEIQVSNVSSTAPIPATQRGFDPCATVTIKGAQITATIKLPGGGTPGGLIEKAGSGG